MEIFISLLLCLLVGIFFLLGIILIKIVKNKDQLCNFSLALALVVVLGLIIFDLIPELNEIYQLFSFSKETIYVIIFLFLGIGLLKLLDHFVPKHQHHHQEKNDNVKEHEQHLYHIGFVTLIPLLLHNVIEGMTIYVISSSTLKTGIIMAIGVSLHNIPLGIEMAVSVFQNLKNKKSIFLLIILTLSSFTGGLIVMFLGTIDEYYLGFILSLALGMLIYLLFWELFPEVLNNIKKKSTFLGFIVGLLILIISVFL